MDTLQIPRRARAFPVRIDFATFNHGLNHQEHVTYDDTCTFGLFDVHTTIASIRNPVTLTEYVIVEMYPVCFFEYHWYQNLVGS